MTDIKHTDIADEPDLSGLSNEIASVLKSINGDYSDTARYSQMLKRVMRSAPNWRNLSEDQRETLEMEAQKIARVLCGDPNYPAHWQSMSDYALMTAARVGDAR